MRRCILLIIGLTVATAPPLGADTFARTPIAPDLGLDALTRGVARERVGRDVFANPYSTVTISNVDLYDRFPYLEARQFEIVSDPRWNRLVCGEAGRSLSAYDGRGGALGALAEPRGMAVDEANRVYVADTGNDRIVVLKAVTEFDHIDLVPQFAITGLSRPWDVAYSDGGTPFQPGDDFLYVAETGRNRVAACALEAGGGHVVSVIGDLGSGPGRFAGPTAITTGRADGANTRDVYVADAHNRRIVHLRHEPQGLTWVAESHQDADLVTSLDTDQWGNVYAAAPREGVVLKLNAALEPVAELRGGLAAPRSFHLPFSNVRDHRDGTVRRVGQPSALAVDRWTDQTGVSLWNLGVAIEGLGVEGGDDPVARFNLTDRAAVTVEITDAASGRLVARHALAPLEAGPHALPLLDATSRAQTGTGDLRVRLSAASSYANGATAVAQSRFRVNGSGTLPAPSKAMLLGNWPNPGHAFTRIAFMLPETAGQRVALRLFDAGGRLVRTFGGQFAPGLNEVTWDGSDDSGHAVRSGLYFYRLDVDGTSVNGRMSFVR